MKFMVNWMIDQDKWMPILEKWSRMTPAERADAGEGVKIIGRWHDMANRSGVLIVEASDAAAIMHYVGQWNPHMDMEVSPVLDDEESAKAARTILESHAG